MVAARCGVFDLAPVVGEPFRQWVIEDHFAARRPDWATAGAEFVADVTPYELIKMRLLNAAQSAFAYFGVLCSKEHTVDAARDPVIGGVVRKMLASKSAETVPAVPGTTPAAYITQVFRRLDNTAIRHRNHQVATDGSQKIVQRVINPIREQVVKGRSFELLAAVVAGWIAYLLAAAPSSWRPLAGDRSIRRRGATRRERCGRRCSRHRPRRARDRADLRQRSRGRSARRRGRTPPAASPRRRPARLLGNAMKRSPSAESESLGYTKPGSYEELRAVLASGSIRLPKRLRQVAIFLWQHPSDVALGTTVSLAADAGVQPSTLVRFAKQLGYAGFSDLQALFKGYLKGGRPALQPGAKAEGGPIGGSRAFVAGFLQAAGDALARAGQDFDFDRFDAVVDSLAAADIIYLVGSKRAFPVTTYMSIAYAKLGIRNVLVDNIGSAAFDQIGWLGQRDVFLAVSFSPYNSITADLAAVAHERGVPVTAITDSALSPLVPLAKDWIEVVENDFAGFRSLGATIAIAMAVVLATAEKRERTDGVSKANPEGRRR